jgi:Flp pilus assembly protein TadG
MAAAAVIRRFCRDERGAELIEFALVLPLLMLVMCGIFDFGFLFQRWEVLTNAAREGARIAALPGYTETDVNARVDSYLMAGGVPGPAVTTLTYQSVTAGGRTFNLAKVTVTYTHDYAFLGPILSIFGGGATTVPLRATATMRVESQGGV